MFFIFLGVCSVFLLSCSYEKTQLTLGSAFDNTWEFSSGQNYDFNDQLIEFSNGRAQLKALDLVTTDSEFDSSTNAGTVLSNNQLTLEPSKSSNTDLLNILPDRASNLLAYWKFEQNLDDSSSNANNGNDNGGVTFAQAKVGTGVHLDGIDDSISTVVTGINNQVTWVGWVKFNSFENTFPRLFINSSLDIYSSTSNQGLSVISGRAGGVADRGLWNIPPMTFEKEKWYFIAVRYDMSDNNNDPEIFIDGSVIAIVENEAPEGALNVTATVNLGDTGGGTRRLNGALDEVALYDTLLSDEEIQTIYNAQSKIFAEDNSLSPTWTPKWNHLVGYWKMDGNWDDSSDNNNHGTETGPVFSSDSFIGSHTGLFDGTDDYVTVPHSADFANDSEITVMAWAKATGPCFGDSIAVKGLGAYEWILYCSGTPEARYSAFLRTTSGAIATGATINSMHRWVHIAMTYNRSLPDKRLRMHLNGELIDFHNGSDTAIDLNTLDLYFGPQFSGVSNGFPGYIDEVSLWSKALSQSEINLIYQRQKQKFASHYDSTVLDLGSVTATWPDFSWLTNLPFGKELVGDYDGDNTPNTDSTASYSSLNSNFGNGLIAYWPLNEDALDTAPGGLDFEDYSGLGNHGYEVDGVIPGAEGKFLKSAQYRGLDENIVVSSNPTLEVANTLSGSLWVKLPLTNNINHAQIFGKTNFSNAGWSISRNGSTDQINLRTDTNLTTNDYITSNATIFDDQWHHIAFVLDQGVRRVYVDGVLDNADTYPHGAGFSNTVFLRIGRIGSFELFGEIDEVALWNRALTDNEVLELYRRGANRIKLQVKSCIDLACNCNSYNVAPAGSTNDCDGDGTANELDDDDSYKAKFIGPGGSGSTYYSELFNKNSSDISFSCALNTSDYDAGVCAYDEVAYLGNSKTTGPEFLTADYTQFVDPSSNRYLQYRVYLEADDNSACSGSPCLPELTQVNFNVNNETKYSSEYVEVKPKSAITFNQLKAIDINASACATFRLARSGTDFYHDGTSWVIVSDESHRNIASEVQNNFTQFASQFGAGLLEVKGYLKSDPTQTSQCVINDIDVDFN